MDQDMMDFGEMEWLMDLEDWSMPKAMYMKASGLKIRQMGMECIRTSMAAGMRASGSKINSMALEWSSGLMVPSTRGSMSMA